MGSEAGACCPLANFLSLFFFLFFLPSPGAETFPGFCFCSPSPFSAASSGWGSGMVDGIEVVGRDAKNSEPASLTFFTQSPRRRLNRSRDQFRITILPVQDSRSSYSCDRREEAILSVRMNSGAEVLFMVGAVVDVRRESRTWEPVVERARARIGSWAEGEVEVGEGGKSRLLMTFRRKGIGFEDVGKRADWMMWEVVVYMANASNVSCGNARRESWIRVAGGPGIESMV